MTVSPHLVISRGVERQQKTAPKFAPYPPEIELEILKNQESIA